MKKLLVACSMIGSAVVLSGCALFDMFTESGAPGDMGLDAEIEDALAQQDDDLERAEAGPVDPESVATFTTPDFEGTMKSRCGASIDYRYCKCAFHNDLCKDLGIKKNEARSYLSERFIEIVDEMLDGFRAECEANDLAIWDGSNERCSYCPAGTLVENGVCVVVEPEEDSPTEADVDTGSIAAADNIEENNSVIDSGSVGTGDARVDLQECKRDSDCPILCEGDSMWTQVCNGRTNGCEKWTETDCGQVTTRVDWRGDEVYDVANICVPAQGCVRGPIPVYERKDSLQQEWKDLQAESQQLNQLYQQAAAFCLGTLTDPVGLVALVASTQDTTTNSAETNQLMADIVSDPESTQTARWCTLEERLKTVDIPAIQAEVDILFARIEKLDQLTDILDSAAE